MKGPKVLGKFIHQFQPETKTLIRKLERVLIQLYRQNLSLLFNETCLNERLLRNHTHTHTHTHIYIYILRIFGLLTFLYHNVLADIFFGLLLVIHVELRSLYRISTWTLYLIHRDWRFQFLFTTTEHKCLVIVNIHFFFFFVIPTCSWYWTCNLQMSSLRSPFLPNTLSTAPRIFTGVKSSVNCSFNPYNRQDS